MSFNNGNGNVASLNVKVGASFVCSTANAGMSEDAIQAMYEFDLGCS